MFAGCDQPRILLLPTLDFGRRAIGVLAGPCRRLLYIPWVSLEDSGPYGIRIRVPNGNGVQSNVCRCVNRWNIDEPSVDREIW